MLSGVDDSPYNKPKSPLGRVWQKYRYSIIIYSSLAILLVIAYHLLSDGDFSFLMTLGSLLTTFSFGLLSFKAFSTRNVAGISLKTLQAFAIVFVARLSSILFYEGYLPFDRSGDWFYQLCEILALIQVVALLVAVGVTFRSSYTANNDVFGRFHSAIPSAAGVVWLAGPALILAIMLHPSLNGNWLTDTMWTWALYLEAVATLPQLNMFSRLQGKQKMLEPFTANFVFGLAAARLLQFIFWISSFHELNDKYAQHWGGKYPGHFVVVSQLVNLIVVGDYVYQYISSARRGDESTVLRI